MAMLIAVRLFVVSAAYSFALCWFPISVTVESKGKSRDSQANDGDTILTCEIEGGLSDSEATIVQSLHVWQNSDGMGHGWVFV